MTLRLASLALMAILVSPLTGYAGQNQAPPPPVEDDPDLDPNPSQPDFTIVNLPTTLRVPRFKSAFRVTHRFSRTLGQGTFADLASDMFGIDSGALIGLEYRFGLMRGLQAGILRTSDRTINLFAHYSLFRRGLNAVDVVAAIDGGDNMTDGYSPSLGVILSREIGRRGAIYVEPMWVNNTNPFPSTAGTSNDTYLVGLGTRLRVGSTVYLVGEFIPRVGYDPGVHHGTFGIEKRAGGHVFQLNFSNGLGNTIGQLARGGSGAEDWYLGFNISRKFF